MSKKTTYQAWSFYCWWSPLGDEHKLKRDAIKDINQFLKDGPLTQDWEKDRKVYMDYKIVRKVIINEEKDIHIVNAKEKYELINKKEKK